MYLHTDEEKIEINRDVVLQMIAENTMDGMNMQRRKIETKWTFLHKIRKKQMKILGHIEKKKWLE